MKLIRWPGFIAFVLLLVVFIGGTLLFAETIARSMLESTLSSINGARVDIASVDMGYTPFSIQLNNVQVADKQRPMVNTVQIGHARFQLSFGNLLLGKVIIDEMSLNDITVDTPRKRSGALAKQVPEKSEDKGESMFAFDMPDIELPDIKEILKLEPLQTDGLVQTLNTDLDSTRENWQATYDEVTDQGRWGAYEARYTQIREAFKGKLAQKLEAIKDAKALRNDLKQEVEKIKQAKQQFMTDTERLEAEYKAAKNGPKNDIRAIREKYNIDKLDTSNITQMLFGEQAAQYIALAQKWYERIKPYLGEDEPEPEPVKRSEGIDVAFREFNPRPGFYVGKAGLNINTARGEFEGNVSDISSDQSINRQPTRFEIAGKAMRNRDSEKINGEINYVQKDQAYVALNYTIRGYQISDFAVSKSSKLAINMAKGLMDLKLQTRLQGGRLKGDAHADFSQVAFQTDRSADSQGLASMLGASLADVSRFNINADFTGSFQDIDLKIRSDLDNQLGARLKTRFKQRVDQFEQELRSRIEARYQEPMQKIEARMQQLRDIKSGLDQKEQALKQQLDELDNRINQEKTLKEQELKSKVDEGKDKLLDKLKSKLQR